MAENERLKEINDIQSKLWRIWLKEHEEESERVIKEDKKGKKKKKRSKKKEKIDENTESRSEDTESGTEFEEEDVWKGLRIKDAEIETESEEEENEIYETMRVRGFKKRKEDRKESGSKNGKNGDSRKGNRRFCHFWNNGRCRHSESECRFLHEESPDCRFGKECNRSTCMFYHPKQEWINH